MSIGRVAPTLLVAAALVTSVAGASGCQSTQAKSAELAKNGDELLATDEIEIAKESSDVKVLDTKVLTGDSGTNVVAVHLENESDQGLINVPIQINIVDAKGKSLFRNDVEGTDPTLISVPVVPPGADTWWVHDQALYSGTAKDVEVTLGAAPEPYPEQPDIEIGKPELVTNESLGVPELKGEVTTGGSEDVADVYFYGIATKGGDVVAAGRAAVDRVKPDPKIVPEYNIFMTGDAEGAEYEVEIAPTFPDEEGAPQ